MNRPLRILAVALGCGACALPPRLNAGAWDQLQNMAGGSVPSVPEPSGPKSDGDSSGGQSSSDAESADDAAAEAEAQAELDRLEAELRAKQEREEQARLAREEQERQQRAEAERQEKLRQQAAAARQQWAAQDEKNGAAFDDVFARASTGGDVGDPNTVDLSHTGPHPTPQLPGGGPMRPKRLRAQPPPVPDFTLVDTPEPLPPPTRWWWPDFKRKTNDMAFAYASMYLKSKIEGLGSLPEKLKDSLDLREKLSARFTQHLESVFDIAGQAADPRSNWAVLAERSEKEFQAFGAAVDEDARNGIRDTIATSGSGSLPEDGADVAEYGISAGREHLQDLQERQKWCDEHRKKRP
jgi:hypothetical protein